MQLSRITHLCHLSCCTDTGLHWYWCVCLQVLGFLNQKRPGDNDQQGVMLQADAFAVLVQMDFVAADGKSAQAACGMPVGPSTLWLCHTLKGVTRPPVFSRQDSSCTPVFKRRYGC